MVDRAGSAVRQLLVQQVQAHASRNPQASVGADLVAAVINEQRLMMSAEHRRQIIVEVLDEVLGAGPLAALLRMPGVTDVVVNGPDQVFIDSGRGLEPAGIAFADDVAVRECASRMARLAGRRLDDAHPFVDAKLPTGERLHVVLSPISISGTSISIRVPRKQVLSWPELRELSSVSDEHAAVVSAAVDSRESVLVTGGTGAGKTTVLNALLGECAQVDRLVVVEDTTELAIAHPHVVQLECRPANAEGFGAVALSDLVRQALRMRPDRIVIGEVRGAEVVDLLMALNTGHTGSMATLHANSPADVPARIEVLAATWGISRRSLHQAIAAAFHLVVHMRRTPSGQRHVAQVARIGMTGGEVKLTPC